LKLVGGRVPRDDEAAFEGLTRNLPTHLQIPL
jgi:hypothetical protein